MIVVFSNLCYTDVVTSIEYKTLVLVRETYWDREVYSLNIFHVILVYQKTWLQTCLESKTCYRIVVQSDRNVNVTRVPLVVILISYISYFYVLCLEALYRIESANGPFKCPVDFCRKRKLYRKIVRARKICEKSA